MSYSTSPITLQRIIREYAPLLQGSSCIWQRPQGLSDEASVRWSGRWSYKLREGLYVAKLYPAEFPELAQIADSVRITTTPQSVEMVLLSRPQVVAETRNVPKHVAPEQVKYIVNFRGIVEHLADHLAKGNTGKLYFANTHLSATDVKALAVSAQSAGWMVLQSRDGALTLAPDDPAVPLEARIQP